MLKWQRRRELLTWLKELRKVEERAEGKKAIKYGTTKKHLYRQ